MNNADATSLLNKIKQHIGYTALRKSIPQLNKYVSTGNGITSSRFHQTSYSYIGIKELSENPDSPTDEYTFTKAFISLLHESTHIYHRYEILKNNSSKSAAYISLGYLAESCSSDYYNKNYTLMPQEIAAQYSAVKNGYAILCQLTNETEANRMICDYVNHHIQDDSEFIEFQNKEPYHNIEDILDAYDKSFEMARLFHKNLDLEAYKAALSDNPDYEESDYVMKALIDGKQEILEKACNANGIQQDFLLAKLYLNYEDPNGYYQKNLKTLSQINFEENRFSIKLNAKQIKPVRIDRITPDFSDFETNEINSMLEILHPNDTPDI